MRQILLDTHVFLWMQFASGKLSDNLQELLQREDVRWHLSQVSLLEIQIKTGVGKLNLPASPEKILPRLIRESGVAYHPLSDAAIFMLGKLPEVHGDPFDRLLIATALTEGWEIATLDPQFEAYPVRTLS